MSAHSIWALVFILGTVQGLFLGFISINFRRANEVTAKLLGALILTFAFNVAEEFVKVAGLIDTLPHFILGTLTLPLMIGPLLFLYGKYLTQKRRHLRKKDYLHFLPFLLATLYFLPFYVLSGDEKLVSIKQGVFGEEIALLATIKGVHMFIYFGAALYTTHARIKGIDVLDQAHRSKIIWYRRMLYAMIFVLLISGTLYYIPFFNGNELWDSDRVTSLLLTLVIYMYAFVAIKHPESVSDVKSLVSAHSKETSNNNGAFKYQTSPFDAKKRQYYLRLLINHMEAAKPYLNPDLNRADVALALSISTHNVSQIINEELEINFYEFVNRYRVEEVKRKLRAGEQTHKTLLAIALEAGFKSKSSFNRVFKQHTGITPSQYLSR